jgi:hypothetical protein
MTCFSGEARMFQEILRASTEDGVWSIQPEVTRAFPLASIILLQKFNALHEIVLTILQLGLLIEFDG